MTKLLQAGVLGVAVGLAGAGMAEARDRDLSLSQQATLAEFLVKLAELFVPGTN